MTTPTKFNPNPSRIGFYRTPTKGHEETLKTETKNTPLAKAAPTRKGILGAARLPVRLSDASNTAAAIISAPGDDYWNASPKQIGHTDSDSPAEIAHESGASLADSASVLVTHAAPELHVADTDKRTESETAESNETLSGTRSSFDSRSESNEAPPETLLSQGSAPSGDSIIPSQNSSLLRGAARRVQYQRSKDVKARILKPKDQGLSSSDSSSTEDAGTSTSTRPKKFAEFVLPKHERITSKKRPSIRSPRKLYRDAKAAKAAKAAAEAEEIKQARLKAISNNLPKGAILDEKTGNLSGRNWTDQYSLEFIDSPNEKSKNFLEYMKNSISAEYNKIVLPCEGGEGSVAANSSITQAAQGDFYRNDIKFYDDEGLLIFSAREGKKTEKQRTFDTTNMLHEFTGGSEASTIILSAMLSQAVPTVFHRSLINSNGEGVKGFRMMSAQNTAGTQKKLIKEDGSPFEIKNIKGLGGVDFKIYKVDGNFMISFDWTCWYAAQMDSEAILPLGEDEVISIRTKATILIDAKSAAERKLAFELPEGIERTFEGRLRIN